MEKKKIIKEKKKRNNLPLIMALCAIIGTSCSVLALSQDFNLGGLFNNSRSDLVINTETIIDCEYKPATTTNVFQVENGDIEISTDGHVQLPLFYSSLEPVLTGTYSGNLSFNVNFESNGFIGIDLPFNNVSNIINSVSLLLQNDNNNLRVVALHGTHHNIDNFELECFSETSVIAYSDTIENSGDVDVQFYWYINRDYLSFKVKVNGKFIDWLNLIDVGVNNFKPYKINGNRLSFELSGLDNFSNKPIYLDCYNVQATVKNLTGDILD